MGLPFAGLVPGEPGTLRHDIESGLRPPTTPRFPLIWTCPVWSRSKQALPKVTVVAVTDNNAAFQIIQTQFVTATSSIRTWQARVSGSPGMQAIHDHPLWTVLRKLRHPTRAFLQSLAGRRFQQFHAPNSLSTSLLTYKGSIDSLPRPAKLAHTACSFKTYLLLFHSHPTLSHARSWLPFQRHGSSPDNLGLAEALCHPAGGADVSTIGRPAEDT